MAWVATVDSNWEYSTTPEADDPYNEESYTGNHTLGIRTDDYGNEIYVYCRQVTDPATPRDSGGFGEINKTAIEG